MSGPSSLAHRPAGRDVEAPAVPPAATRGLRRALFALFVVQALVFLGGLRNALERTWLDTSDEAAYAEQARSLLAGRGLEIGFVAHHHVPRDPDILHPEDVYPPGAGALLAMSFLLFGDSPSAAAAPGLFFGIFVLPLLGFALVRRLGGSAAAALGAAVALLVHPVLVPHHLRGLADLPLACAVLGALVAALGEGARRASLAGLLLAAGFWFKPTALLFCPAVALVHFGPARDRRRAVLGVLWMALLFLAGAAPWLARNVLVHGDPLYSANKFITALANRPGYLYEDNFKVYWAIDGFEIPGLLESIRLYGWSSFLTRFLVHLYQFFFERGGVVFTFAVLAAGFFALFARVDRWLAVFVAVFAVLLSLAFAVELRYLIPCVPVLVALVFRALDRCAPAWEAAERTLAPAGWRRPPAFALALTAALLFSAPGAARVARDALHGLPGPSRDDRSILEAGTFARSLPAEARVLTTQPARMRYYSRRLAVSLPMDEPERIEAVCQRYRIDTLVLPDWGPLCHAARLVLDTYFERFGDRWRRERPAGASFTVWFRR